jgi:hypothetical protein
MFICIFWTVQGETNIVISCLFFLIYWCCVFFFAVFLCFGLEFQERCSLFLLNHFPLRMRHVTSVSAVSPLPLLRLIRRHWGLPSFAPSWYFGAPFPMGPWARGVPGIARPYLHGMTATGSLSTRHLRPFSTYYGEREFGCVCSWMLPLSGKDSVYDRKKVLLCRPLSPWSHLIFVKPSDLFGGEVVSCAPFRWRLPST